MSSGRVIHLKPVSVCRNPSPASSAMEEAGPRGFFLLLAAVTGGLALYALYRIVIARPLAA